MGERTSLDPADWRELRAQGHLMLDDMFDHLEGLRAEPVWRPIPDALREAHRTPPPRAPDDLGGVHEQFLSEILPYGGGNLHPGFMGWVQGAGTPVGMLAEMLAAGLNANLGGRDHMPIEIEREVIGWMRQLFGFPEGSSGVMVGGASMANFIGVLIARTRALGDAARAQGLGGAPLTAYASVAAHSCVPRAMEMAGLGAQALRLIPVDQDHRIDHAALKQAIADDRRSGSRPFLLVGNAGTVDTGAIDDLDALADIAMREDASFHVDGAYGALGVLSGEIALRLKGLERADTLAFDFHKWAHVPYDAAMILARDGELHRRTFASPAAYLQREPRGLAGGDFWPCDYGPDLSRGFRALKTWFTLKTIGLDALGGSIEQSCALARALEQRVRETPELELLAPAQLNIVCFRFACEDADAVNRAIVADLHEAGAVAPSLTRIGGAAALRAALFNHRTEVRDIEALIAGVLAFGRARTGEGAP